MVVVVAIVMVVVVVVVSGSGSGNGSAPMCPYTPDCGERHTLLHASEWLHNMGVVVVTHIKYVVCARLLHP